MLFFQETQPHIETLHSHPRPNWFRPAAAADELRRRVLRHPGHGGKGARRRLVHRHSRSEDVVKPHEEG